MAEERKLAVRPFFSTPFGLVVFALLVYLGAVVAGTLTLDVVPNIEFRNADARLLAKILLLGTAVVLYLIASVMMIVGSIRWALFGHDFLGVPRAAGNEQILQLLQTMNQRLLVSDTAKRIAYRQQDVNALRRTIREDITKGEFDAAMVMVQEMSQTFGYREEAEIFREQIVVARATDMDAKTSSALANLEQILENHAFDRAAKEAEKIERLFPDSENVRDVVLRVAQAREQYKHDLERQFLAASERDEVDRAISLLKELDKYLTEEEAEPFRETARGIIGKKRDNLGVQFKMAVHDKEWLRAVSVGEQIIREFPNTRMADEVRAMLDLLRERAAGKQATQSA